MLYKLHLCYSFCLCYFILVFSVLLSPLLPNYLLIMKEIAITREQASNITQCKTETRMTEIVIVKLLSAYPVPDSVLRTYKVFSLYNTL